MPRPAAPHRVAAVTALAACAVALSCASASAEGVAGVHSYSGGAVDATTRRLGSTTGVGLTTFDPLAVVGVRVSSRRCSTGGVQRLGTRVAGDNGFGSIDVARTVRPRFGARRGRLRIAVALRVTRTTAGPVLGEAFAGTTEALSGTVSVSGTLPRGRRGHVACRFTAPVELRRDPSSPRPGTAAVALRTGPTGQTVSGPAGGSLSLPGSFVLAPVRALLPGTAPTRLVASFDTRVTCTTHGRTPKTYVESYALGPFAVGADGRFRHVERGTYRSGRQRVRYSYVVSGAISADGIARGAVRIGERYTRKRFYAVSCTTPSIPFVASP